MQINRHLRPSTQLVLRNTRCHQHQSRWQQISRWHGMQGRARMEGAGERCSAGQTGERESGPERQIKRGWECRTGRGWGVASERVGEQGASACLGGARSAVRRGGDACRAHRKRVLGPVSAPHMGNEERTGHGTLGRACIGCAAARGACHGSGHGARGAARRMWWPTGWPAGKGAGEQGRRAGAKAVTRWAMGLPCTDRMRSGCAARRCIAHGNACAGYRARRERASRASRRGEAHHTSSALRKGVEEVNAWHL